MLITLTAGPVAAKEERPWEHPQGPACFERWIAEAMSRLNRYDGNDNFNARKPWVINKYGLPESRSKYGPRSVYEPDDFKYYGKNKYWWMWAHYKKTAGRWGRKEWNGARIPSLRKYVRKCIKKSGGGGGGGGGGNTGGNACGHTLGSGILNKWNSLGGRNGFLDCPVMSEAEAGRSPQGTRGRYARFRGGDGGFIIWHRNGRFAGRSFEVHGCIFLRYRDMDGTNSWLGFPVSDEYAVRGGRRNDFEGGYIFWDSRTRECQAYRYGETPGQNDNRPRGRLIETITVPNTKKGSRYSRTVLKKGKVYTIEASGTFSNWSKAKTGVDAVWCYDPKVCSKSRRKKPYDHLKIDGKGMTEIAGRVLPYNPRHLYRVNYRGQGKKLELYLKDTRHSPKGNSGKVVVKIYE